MTKKELAEAVESQLGRYTAIQFMLDYSSARENYARGESMVCTVIEDAAEFGIHLMKDWCGVDNEEDAINTTS